MAGHCRGDHAGSHPSPQGTQLGALSQADMTPVGDVFPKGIILEKNLSHHSERVFCLKLNAFS